MEAIKVHIASLEPRRASVWRWLWRSRQVESERPPVTEHAVLVLSSTSTSKPRKRPRDPKEMTVRYMSETFEDMYGLFDEQTLLGRAYKSYDFTADQEYNKSRRKEIKDELGQEYDEALAASSKDKENDEDEVWLVFEAQDAAKWISLAGYSLNEERTTKDGKIVARTQQVERPLDPDNLKLIEPWLAKRF